MKVINTKEVTENGSTFIVTEYDNGIVEQIVKSDFYELPPIESEPMPEPITLEQIQANQYDMMEAIADLYLMQDGGATV